MDYSKCDYEDEGDEGDSYSFYSIFRSLGYSLHSREKEKFGQEMSSEAHSVIGRTESSPVC